MMRRLLAGRLRLVDAVAIAAAALLALKAVELAAGGVNGTGPSSAEAELARGDDRSSFAGVLARARTNYVPPEVATTGAVSAKPGAVDDQGTPKAPELPLPAGGGGGSPSERAVLERLGERRDVLERRGRDMETRERLLENAEKKLEGRINELKTLEKAESGAGKRLSDAGNALQGVVTMYEAMKPKDAARVFDRLALDVLVPLVQKMNPRKMAEVLAVMQAESAERLTVALTARARNPEAAVRSTPGSDLPSTELQAIDSPTSGSRKGP